MRSIDPSTLTRGGGLASRKSVEASAFVHPTQGLDGLVAHIVDPSRAHMAEAIGLVDAGGLYASDEVEGALQEIAGSHAATHQNGVYQGGTYTAAGLTVTLDTPTSVVVGGTLRDLSGEAIAIADNATNWLYVNGSTGVLATTSGAVPSISSPENVLLARIVTLAGAITSSRDARWFVRNLDRKISLTIRNAGTTEDKNSEAAFESLDAAILYLENFGSGVIRTHTLVIKGALTITSSLTIPVDGVTLQGEDGCILTTGGVLSPMFNINGRSTITFKNILFQAAHAGSTAIAAPASGAVSLINVVDCQFLGTGGQNWVVGIDVNLVGPQTQVVVSGGSITASQYGIRLMDPVRCRVSDIQVSEAGAAGNTAVVLGATGGGIGSTTDCQVRGLSTSGFATSLFLRGRVMRAQSCYFVNGHAGITVGPNTEDVTITNSTVSLDPVDGLSGITLDGTRAAIRGCQIANLRNPATYAAEVPTGISVATNVDNVIIADTVITNFLNTVTPGGYGILFVGASANSIVQGSTIDTAEIGISTPVGSGNFRINGSVVEGVKTGVIAQFDVIISGTNINLDATRAMTGIEVLGIGTRVTSCNIANPRGSGSYGVLDVPVGVLLDGSTQTVVSDTQVTGFYNATGTSGACIAGGAPSTDTTIDGCFLSGGFSGIDALTITSVTVSNTQIKDVDAGIYVGNTYNVVTGCLIEVSSTRGVTGIAVEGDDTTISNCVLVNNRAVYAGETPTGVDVSAANVKVSGCRIVGWNNTVGTLGAGILIKTGGSRVTASGNTFEKCWYGIYSDAAAAADTLLLSSNMFVENDAAGISVTNSEQVCVIGNTVNQTAASSVGIEVKSGTDVEVVGNKVNGDSAATYGIILEGGSGATDQLRRFVVSNNNVRAVTTAGIGLSGYVQNGVVSGNHVDCNLSAGDPSATACILLTSSGTAIPKYVDIADNVCWRARNGISVSGVSYLVLATNIKVVGNTIHHCAVGSATTTTCSGIYLSQVRDSIVSGNTIFQIGQLISDTDVVSNPVAGADVYPYGVQMSNVTSITVSDNNVSNLINVGAGTSQGITLTSTGNAAPSPVLIRTVNVTGNRIFSDDGVPGLTVGISVVSGQVLNPGDTSSIYGLNISNNTLRNLTGPGVFLSVGGGCTTEQVVISGNVISQISSALIGTGVHVLVLSSTDFTDGIMRDVDVAHNVIGDTGDRGILVAVGTGCVLSGLSIQDNTVSNTGGEGIDVTASAAPSVFENLTISRNKVFDPGDDAISVFITDYATTNIAIDENMIADSGGGFVIGKGIVIETDEGAVIRNDITSLSIRGNVIAATHEGIHVDLNGLLLEAVISGNTVRVNDVEGPIRLDLATDSTIVSEAFSQNIIISDNSLFDGEDIVVAISGGQKLSNFEFTNNTVSGVGASAFKLTVAEATVGTGDAVRDVLVAGNTFEDVVGTPITIELGSAATIDDCANITITHNQFFDCATAGVNNRTVFVDVDCILRNLVVADNVFKDCGAADTLSGVVELRFGNGVGPTNSAENVTVSRNSFNDCSGPAVYVRDNTASAAWTIVNLCVDDNVVQENTYSAIYLALTAFTAARGISISGNHVDSVVGAANDAGIEVHSPTATSIDQLQVCRNTIRSTGGGTPGAIYLDINEDANDVIVDGNTVVNDSSTLAGIYAIVEGQWSQGSVSSNSINTTAGAGIRVAANASLGGTTGIVGLRVSQNQIRATTRRGIHVDGTNNVTTPNLHNITISSNTLDAIGSSGVSVEAVSGTAIDDLSIQSNTIRDASFGIRVEVSGAVPAENIVISGNIIRDIVNSGISIEPTGGGWTGNLVNATVIGNSLTDVAEYGIALTNTISDFSEIVVANNNVRNIGTTGSDYGGIYIVAIDGQNISVTGNVVRSTAQNVIGYWIILSGISRTVTVSDNIGNFESAANTESLRYETGLSVDQLNLSFTGNNFRNAATGVNDNGSAFTPDYSVCAHNVERTSGGAGNWAAFTAAFGVNSITTPNQD